MKTEALLKRTLAALAMTLVAGFAAAPASAGSPVPPPRSTFYFNADCTDCAAALNVVSYGVLGTLTLQSYSPGSAITGQHFVSFEYSGSNLVDPYIVDRVLNLQVSPNSSQIISTLNRFTFDPSVDFISGAVTPDTPINNFRIIFDDALGFHTEQSGLWYTCAPKDNVYYGGANCSEFSNGDIGTGGWSNTASVVLGAGAPIPEPASYAMMALGLLGLALGQRARRAS